MKREIVAAWILASMIVLGTSISAGTVIYYGWYERSWLVYTNLPFPIINEPLRDRHPGELPQVKVGEPALTLVGRKSLLTITRNYTVSHSLICHHQPEQILASESVALRAGFNGKVVSRINIVPLKTEPDICHVEGIADVPGQIRNITVPWSSEEFEVVR